jgi:hypothetical protein
MRPATDPCASAPPARLPASDIDRLVVAETSAIDEEDEADRCEAIAADPVLTTPAYRQAAHSQRIEAAGGTRQNLCRDCRGQVLARA